MSASLAGPTLPYRREIDGLRALAVLPVLLFHAGVPHFDGGFVGVDIFFVLSGYLITSIIVAERAAGAFTLARFYERRARRILPALLCVTAATLPFAWRWMLPADLDDYGQSVAAVAVFASNLLFWRQSGYFDAPAEAKPLLHTWSLAVEEQYYLLFPLLVLALWRFGRPGLLRALAALALASFALAQWATAAAPEAAFYLLPTRAWELLGGACLALASPPPGAPARRFDGAAALLGLGLVAWAVLAYSRKTPFPGAYALAPAAGAALLIACATPGTLVGRLLGWTPLVGIGLLSYSAYLWHQPLFVFARLAGFSDAADPNLAALLAATLALAYASWRWVERPFRGPRVPRRALAYVAGAGTAALLAAGIAIHGADGFEASFNAEKQETLRLVERLDRDRSAMIRLARCHFNAGVGGATVEAFLARWDCADDPQRPGLKRIPAAVTGDSHSADLAAALKENGLLPLQMGGAGCSLNPRRMSRDCARIFEALRARIARDPAYDTLILAQRFETAEELSPESLREIADYWQGFGKKVVLLTALPAFDGFKTKLVQRLPLRPNLDLARLSERPEAVALLEARGIHVANARDAFCGGGPGCAYEDADGNLLLVDPDHLSRAGARLFGRRLIERDAAFRALAARAR